MKSSTLFISLVILLSPCTTVLADPWGLLFTTPGERARLDSGQAESVPSASSSSGGTKQAHPVQSVRVTGTLTSSRGKRTAWLNGKPAGSDVRVLGAGHVQFRPASSNTPLLIKSGQRFDPQTGEIVEGYTVAPVAENTPAQSLTDTPDAPM